MTFNFDLKSLTKAVDINASIAQMKTVGLATIQMMMMTRKSELMVIDTTYHHSGCLM